MRLPARIALASALLLPTWTGAQTTAQPKPAAQPKAAQTKPATAAPSASAPVPVTGNAAAANMNQPVATVAGEPVTKREVINVLGEFQIPPGSEQRAYDNAVDLLVNTRILEQYLRKANVPVDQAAVEKQVDQDRKTLEAQGASLEKALAEGNMTLEEYKDRIARALQWKKFVTDQGTDAELKKYFEQHKDLFSGTQLRASHILVALDDNASAEAKSKARQKLESIKAEIQGGKISFADAANKYSEDPGNKTQPTGGDLGFFPRRGVFIEEFANAAFGMKDANGKYLKGAIIGPVETEYGLHLIQLTDVKEGRPVEFEPLKDEVLNTFAADLQERIVESERTRLEKANQIKVEPMPQDLFSTVPATEAAPAASAPAPAARPRRSRDQAGHGPRSERRSGFGSRGRLSNRESPPQSVS